MSVPRFTRLCFPGDLLVEHAVCPAGNSPAASTGIPQQQAYQGLLPCCQHLALAAAAAKSTGVDWPVCHSPGRQTPPPGSPAHFAGPPGSGWQQADWLSPPQGQRRLQAMPCHRKAGMNKSTSHPWPQCQQHPNYWSRPACAPASGLQGQLTLEPAAQAARRSLFCCNA